MPSPPLESANKVIRDTLAASEVFLNDLNRLWASTSVPAEMNGMFFSAAKSTARIVPFTLPDRERLRRRRARWRFRLALPAVRSSRTPAQQRQ